MQEKDKLEKANYKLAGLCIECERDVDEFHAVWCSRSAWKVIKLKHTKSGEVKLIRRQIG